jgi:hypothetical protein
MISGFYEKFMLLADPSEQHYSAKNSLPRLYAKLLERMINLTQTFLIDLL